MASMCSPTFPSPRKDPSPYKLNSVNCRLSSPKFGRRTSRSDFSLSRLSESAFCRPCVNGTSSGADNSNPGPDDSWRWDVSIQETFRNAIKRFDDYLTSLRDQNVGGNLVVTMTEGREEEEEWDWERWRKHFDEIDEQERIVSILKGQLASAIVTEDYKDAARIKVAIAAATAGDTVGMVISHLKKFVEEEQYGDATLMRDYAGAGLVGWWAGLSKDATDPYGRIICISAEYGRYVARSYSPRQLATAAVGAPLFEVYIRNNKGGNYKQQAVYLRRKGATADLYVPPFKPSGGSQSLDSRDARDNNGKLFDRSSDNTEDGEDKDDDTGVDNILRDMIPGVKVKVVKVTAPEKVNRDMVSKVIEQILEEEEEEDDEKDYDLESIDSDNEIQSENEDEHNDVDLDPGSQLSGKDAQNQIALEVVVGDGFLQKLSRGSQAKDLLRVPARIEKNGRMSFTFTVEEDAQEKISAGNGQSTKNKRAKLPGDRVMLDLVKSIGKGKIPTKVLKDVGELINLTINQARNRQPLSGSTTFNRIDVSSTPDPLNGLYIGAHGIYSSEVINLERRFGQWKEDGSIKRSSKIEFYEYVEAVKLTGDAYVPAGQVAFRAKVGKKHQLQLKGVFPEEFGVIGRYRGQGRLAEPGFKNARWVDGELIVLDGKRIKGGPVVGFVYGASAHNLLVFFNRLRLLN